MRALLFLLPLLVAAGSTKAQTLPGYVTIQNSGKAAGKKKPLSAAPASVLAKGATDAVVRDADGYFQLVFDDKKPGQDVEINVVKPDYEVVNYEDLQARLPEKSSKAPALRIYLCPQGAWRHHADAYYATNMRVVSDNYDRRIRAAEQRLAAAGNAGRALADSVNRLIRERDEVLVLLKGYADQFARVNLDDVTERYRTAFRYFAAGKLDSFLLAANEKAILADLARVEAEIKRAKTLGKTGRDKVAAGEALRRQTLEELLIRARALALNSQWDEADRTLGMVAAEDSSNQNIQREYHDFKVSRLQRKEAMQIAEKMLRLTKNPLDSLNWLSRLGEGHANFSDYDQALQYRERQMDILKRCKSWIPHLYLVSYAYCLQDMAAIYGAKGDFKKAEQLDDEALSIYERAARVNKQVAQLALPNQLMNLGDRYMRYANYPKAEATFLRAWEVKRKEVDTTTVEYQNWCATLKEYLATVYMNTNRLEKAASLRRELVDYWAGQATRDPKVYTVNHLYAIKNLAASLSITGNLIEVERYLTLADSLLQHGPIPPGNEILRGEIMSLKRTNDMRNKRYEIALDGTEAGINYYRNLLPRDSLAFGDKLAMEYVFLLSINFSLDRKENNIALYQEYLALLRSLQRMQPQKYTETLAYGLKIGNSTWLPRAKRDSTLIEEAEVLYEQLALENPDKYASSLASCQSDLGFSALFRRDTAVALKYYEKAWATFSKYSANKQGLTGDAHSLSNVLMSLGHLYFYRDPVRADSCFRQGLAYANNVVEYQTTHRINLCSYLLDYGIYKSNYGQIAEAINLLKECIFCLQNSEKNDPETKQLLLHLSLELLGNIYLLNNQPEKSLAAYKETVLEGNMSKTLARGAREVTAHLFAQMEVGNTDSLVVGLDAFVADSTFDAVFFPAFYHFGKYVLDAGKPGKAKAVFRKINRYYQASLKAGYNAYGTMHTQVMSALLSTETARAAALQYAESGKDTRRKEALDLLDAAEKSLRSVPDSTPGRAMVAAKIAGVRAELKN